MTHIINTEIIQSLSNLNLLSPVEEGIGELLSLSKRTLNDLESRDVAQEVTDRLVWIRSGGWMRVASALNSGETWMV